MHWHILIDNELQRIRHGENPGRTRTTARRIAGIALQHFYGNASDDFLRLIQQGIADENLPVHVRSALGRLGARLDAQFSSPSIDPIGDAMAVVDFVKQITPQR
jgi:hypothetical protein